MEYFNAINCRIYLTPTSSVL